MCFDVVKKEYWIEGCKPVVGMDGCFLKGYHKGELLTCVRRDGTIRCPNSLGCGRK